MYYTLWNDIDFGRYIAYIWQQYICLRAKLCCEDLGNHVLILEKILNFRSMGLNVTGQVRALVVFVLREIILSRVLHI